MVPAGNKAKRLSSVNHTTKTIHHHHQLYSSAKPLRSVPCSVNRFVKFCFLPFLKWRKIWFCYVHKWIGKKEISAEISKCLCRNLFKGAATQIRAVYKDNEILVTFKRCICLLSFKTWNTTFPLFYDCRTYENIFRLFDESANKTNRLLIWKWTVREWG